MYPGHIVKDDLSICSQCGTPFFYVDGVSHHLSDDTAGDGIDHELDADHVAYTDEQGAS